MRLINWIKAGLNRWRRRIEVMQYHDGFQWVYSAYYNEGYSLDYIERQIAPLGRADTTAFDRGAHDAITKLQWDLSKTIERNRNGDPVGVPYFIHPGNMDHTRVGQGPVVVYTVDSEKEKAARPPLQCDECGGTGVVYEGGLSMNPEIDNEVPCPVCH